MAHAGLPAYCPPKSFPVDLNAGYPESFIKKLEDEATPVEVVIRGAQHAGFDLASVSFCTFRCDWEGVGL